MLRDVVLVLYFDFFLLLGVPPFTVRRLEYALDLVSQRRSSTTQRATTFPSILHDSLRLFTDIQTL